MTGEKKGIRLQGSFPESREMNLSTYEQVQLMLSVGQRSSLERVQGALEENPLCLEKVQEKKEEVKEDA